MILKFRKGKYRAEFNLSNNHFEITKRVWLGFSFAWKVLYDEQFHGNTSMSRLKSLIEEYIEKDQK